ncbi:MAG: alpha/beta hydrolase [Rhodopirellula sp.]|nr:alpha/beta hydrolase [Rhodopirellula sp.]
MRHLLIITAFLLLVSSGPASSADDSPHKLETLSLWNGQAPNGDGTSEEVDVRLTLHRPEKPNGTAIVICPGGGYGGLVTGGEGHGIAKWLNGHGITGLVLEYRLPKGRPYVPLLDAQRAIRTARANAKEWNLDAKKIGIIGFSAGGHLASTAATHFDSGIAQSQDPVTRQSCRPDFAILIYPVITMDKTTHAGSRRNLLGDKPSDELIELFSNEKQVTDESPPTYLAHAMDDRVVVPANSQAFHDALKAHNVPTEYLQLPSGGHGLNGYKGPMWDAWQKQSLEWLATIFTH